MVSPRSASQTSSKSQHWVPETSFGKWFLSTGVWYRWVLTEAIQKFSELLNGRDSEVGTLLDIGCGQGASFSLLDQYFSPKQLIGVDIDAALLGKASQHQNTLQCKLSLLPGSAYKLPIEDNSIDLIFCHQLIHHVSDQDTVLKEIYRVLKPGGFALFSESCKPFIDTWTVRWFFRHPDGVQKTNLEYQSLIRQHGFVFDDVDTYTWTPWWSLPDLGLKRKWGFSNGNEEITELQVVAAKPVGTKKD